MANELTKRPEAELVTIKDRERSLVGWKRSLAKVHLDTHLAKNSWCSVDCMAATIFGRVSEQNRKAIRQRLRGLAGYLIEHSQFLVVQYTGKHGRAEKIKAYTGNTAEERQAAISQLDRMRTRGEISAANYEKARRVIETPDEISIQADV